MDKNNKNQMMLVYELINNNNLTILCDKKEVFENHMSEFFKRVKNDEKISIEIPKSVMNEIKKYYLLVATKIFNKFINNKLNKKVEIFLIASHLQISN